VSLAKQYIFTAKRDDGSGVEINALYNLYEVSGNLTNFFSYGHFSHTVGAVAGLKASRYKESESADINLSKMNRLQS
jgi:hypothetical protein